MLRASSAFALLVIPATLIAQRPQCPRSAGDTAAVMPPDIDRLPVADSSNGWPTYPGLLEQAGISGAVRVIFTVDTAGVPERATIVIVRTPNAGFDSMVYVPGQLPNPPGEDPYHIRFRAKRALSPTQVLFDLDIAHGTGGTHYRCGVTRRSGGWRARCFIVSSWMS